MLFDFDQNFAFTPEQVQDINSELTETRSQRVRAAIFPETLPEGAEIPSTAQLHMQNAHPGLYACILVTS